MKKTYAILRTEKLKSWSTVRKSVGHNLRTSNDERSNLAKNFDEPIRVLGGDVTWERPWKKQVDGMWLPALKQGDRHTLAREFFLGASPEFFIGKSPQAINEWAEDNFAWLVDRFGADRVKLAVLHLDEQTPHIAAYVVPLKADTNRAGVLNDRANGWTLSDKAINLGGNSSDLVTLQDEYAARMKRFGLERGERNSKADHQTIAEWRRQMTMTLPKMGQFKAPAPSMRERFDVTDYGQRVANHVGWETFKKMKPFYMQAKRVPTLQKQVDKQSGMIESLKDAVNGLKSALGALLGADVDIGTTEGIEALRTAVLASKSPGVEMPSIDFAKKTRQKSKSISKPIDTKPKSL